MQLKDWQKVITKDFPTPGPVTKKTIELTHRESNRFRGSMRISTGRVWTDKEFERYRQKVLNTPLP